MSVDTRSFDPTVGFMFFGSWIKAIESVKSSMGDSAALALFSAIAEYSMYDIEPNFPEYPILNAVWATMEREIDLSIGNRKRWFSKDALNEKHQAIMEAVAANPEASIRKIAAMTGTDKNMVDRVKRKYTAEIEAAIAANASNPVNDVADACHPVNDIAASCDPVSDAVIARESVCDSDDAIAYDNESYCEDDSYYEDDIYCDNDSMRQDNTGQMGQFTHEVSPKQSLIDYYTAAGVDMSAYEEDEDGLPF